MAAPRLLSSPPTKTMVIFLLFWRKFANLYLSNLLSHEMLLDNRGGGGGGIFSAFSTKKKEAKIRFYRFYLKYKGRNLKQSARSFQVGPISILASVFRGSHLNIKIVSVL